METFYQTSIIAEVMIVISQIPDRNIDRVKNLFYSNIENRGYKGFLRFSELVGPNKDVLHIVAFNDAFEFISCPEDGIGKACKTVLRTTPKCE